MEINKILKPKHKCRKLASALMSPGRDWWIGELLEPIPEWPKETHCLHMKTPMKDIVFLCNRGDFENLLVMSNVIIGLKNINWLNSVTKAAVNRANK